MKSTIDVKTKLLIARKTTWSIQGSASSIAKINLFDRNWDRIDRK